MPEITIGRLKGRLVGIWYQDGKRVRRRLAARTRTEAEAEALDLWRRAQPSETATVESIWHAYIEDRAGRPIARTMGYTAKTILPAFGAFRPDQITAERCRAYTARRRAEGIGDGTIWTELGHLRTALAWGAKVGLIDRAPHIERPAKPAPKDRYLTRAEIARLLAVEGQPHTRLAMLLMLSTGARVGAVLDLTWDRVDLERGMIDLRLPGATTRKGRAVVPINDGLRAALEEARRAALSDHVVEWAGRPVKSLRTGLASVARQAKVDGLTPHVFRHTAAVHMAEAGVPMEEISQYLGHSNVGITARVYARFSPDHLRKAASVVDFTRDPS